MALAVVRDGDEVVQTFLPNGKIIRIRSHCFEIMGSPKTIAAVGIGIEDETDILVVTLSPQDGTVGKKGVFLGQEFEKIREAIAIKVTVRALPHAYYLKSSRFRF